MKNYIISLLCVLFAFGASAQHTTPRTGTGANNDNTYRAMNFQYKALTDATGLDTVKLYPNSFHYQISLAALNDSIALSVPSVANCYLGDQIEITVTNTSGGKCVKWAGAYWKTATSTAGGGGGQLYLSASKKATITFVFDGAYWVEKCRMAQ